MSAFVKAISEIKFYINREILKIAFDSPRGFTNRKRHESLDEKILAAVIRPKVMTDINYECGEEIIVDLAGLTNYSQDNFNIYYVIPPERLGFRELVSVLSVGYYPMTGTFTGINSSMSALNSQSFSDATFAMNRVAASFSSIPNVSNAHAQIVGPNTVLIREQARVGTIYNLRCRVAHDSELMNITPALFPLFSKLCIEACKIYIYVNLSVQLDRGYIEAGYEIGEIKNIIERFSDAEEKYEQLKKDWAAAYSMSTPDTISRYIQLNVSPGI